MALGDGCQRVGDEGVHFGIAVAESPNRVARKQRVDLHFGKDVGNAIVLVIKEYELLMFGGGAKLQHQRILCFGRISVALGLIVETQIDRIGRGEGTRLRLHDGVQTNPYGSQVFRHKGIADGVVVNLPIGIQNIKSGTVAVRRTERETVIHQHIIVGPFRRVGIESAMAEIVEKGEETRLGNASSCGGLLCRGPEVGQYLLRRGLDGEKSESHSQGESLKIRLHIHSRWFQSFL